MVSVKKDIVLVIDRVEAGLVPACIKIEKKLGYRLTGIRLVSKEYKNMPDTTYSKDETGFFHEIVVDYDDSDELQVILKKIKDRILVLNCRDEGSIQAFIKIIPFLPNVKTPNETTLRWATEKDLMRNMLAAYDPSLVPKYIKLPKESIEKLDEKMAGFSFPVIVKPAGLNTSMLVSKCENLEELKNVLQNSYKIIEEVYEQQRGNGEPILLVEEFIKGEMYSIDAYAMPDGENILCLPPVKVITANDMGLEGFYGYERIVPADLSASDIQEANQTAINAVRALNLRSCTTHIELYKTASGWKIIEVGPRIGGYRQLLYELSYGIDHYYNDLVSRINGLEPIMPEHPVATAVCANFYPEKEGKLISIEGIKEVRALSTNVNVRQFVKTGDYVTSAKNGGFYFADAIFAGQDADQVLSDAKKAHDLIRVKVHSK